MKMMIVVLFMLFTLPKQNVFIGEETMEMVIIETDFGNIEMELEEEEAPGHSENFRKLVKEGFYDSTTFHRVIPGFIVQGGDPFSKDTNPQNDGLGGPGYTVPAEIGLPHVRGAVGAARQGDAVNPERESNGSQFYICLEAKPHLDRLGYTIFAKVVKGMNVVDEIAAQKVNGDRPFDPVVMKKVYLVSRKPTE
jgi:cyclophilin family peptidyl-prolyl cis-trans isomerase